MARHNHIPKFQDYDLEIKGLRLPQVSLTDEDYRLAKVEKGVDSEEFLKSLSYTALSEMGIDDPVYLERLDYELGVYKNTGFTDYIILVWDILNFCRKNKIPVGKGRGSCPASLVLYCIGVTGIDPIKYELYFERFVSEARAKSQIIDGVRYVDGLMAPDVDIDIAHEHRAKVAEYLFEKYPSRCCKLSTTATLKGRAVIKETCKIVGEFHNDKAEELAKAVPELFGKVFSVEKSNKESKVIKEFFEENPKVFDIAQKIEGLIKNKSSHASGYLIAYDDNLLGGIIPLERNKEDELVSAFDMNYAQILCIKVDLLGLQDLTLLSRVCERIGIDYNDIDVEDPSIYEHFKNEMPTPYGLFQIGADCNFRVLNKVKPRNLSQLAAVISLARPGALAYVDQFARYIETGEFESVHEFFDETLKETGSIPIYQENLLAMAGKVGFTAGESEILRRATAKKSQEKTKEWKEKISQKIQENELDTKIGEVLWKVASESADYSFNKCLKKSSLVDTKDGHKTLEEVKVGECVRAYDCNLEQDIWVTVLDKINNEAELFKITLEDGREINCSLNHKLLCTDKVLRSVLDIILDGHEVF